METRWPTSWMVREVAPRLYTEECLTVVEEWAGSPSAPSTENRRKAGIRIFRQGWIEHGLGKAHPLTPLLWSGPLVAYGVYRGVSQSGPLAGLALLFLGVVLWTLLEYLLHRWLFHLPSVGPGGKMRAFLTHGYHHEFPNDKMRLVAPPLMGWTLATAVGLLYTVIFGRHWAPVFGGTALGYLAYDWIHYYTHHFHPRNRVGKWLRRYHLMHHFQDAEGRYGISSPLWDLVFRTFRRPTETG